MAKSKKRTPVRDGWQEFLGNIRAARKQLKTDTVWYRGHTNATTHTLLPSLLRYPNGIAKERLLYERYEQAAAALKGERRVTAWETLFDMQHYYIPTRLLDWTEVLGVAVFFATLREDGDACVYVLDPAALNFDATGTREIKRRDVADFDYKKVYWERKAAILPSKPIAMEPMFQNPRLLAQKGMFTIHNDERRALDEQCPSCVRKVVLPLAAREGACEFLRDANLNQFSIFPDMVGLAPFIKSFAELG